MPAPFRLYNTLSRSIEPFEPIAAGKVKLYCCGMTVYDDAHVGHARAMVWFDVVVRYLRHREWDVTFVRNFTDVDDKIIRRANERGEDANQLAQRYIDHFHRDADALGLVRPDVEPRVSTSIEAIQKMISQLIERGHAYEAGDSVWFSVSSFNEYGKLSNQRAEDLRASKSADVGTKKESADFALWKGAKPGEPSWQSPWGPGRPGWHIECSAMCCEHLGDGIDIHGGGLDLVFPHHENEVAQAECATGHAPFSRYWMHNGLLVMSDGAKMGKSLGNAYEIYRMVEQFPSEALRLYYLQNHYRSPLPFSEQALPTALAMLARLYEAREVAESMQGSEDVGSVVNDLGADAKAVHDLGRGFAKRFYRAMDDDFNTAQALGHAFELARAINRFANHKKAQKRGGPVVAAALEAFKLIAAGTGLVQLTSAEFHEEVKRKRLPSLGLTAADVEKLLEERTAARTNKDWGRADEIRNTLVTSVIVVMDRADRVDWKLDLVGLDS